MIFQKMLMQGTFYNEEAKLLAIGTLDLPPQSLR
jgi:hypothetical protein